MDTDVLHVALGIIKNNKNQVLLSQRSSNVHHANLWEFPRGTLERGETVKEALCRVLSEEFAYTIKSAQPLIKVRHDDGVRSVLLDVWQVNVWEVFADGKGQGREGQTIEWVDISSLGERDFPATNKAIIKAIRLSHFYLICPEPRSHDKDYLNKFRACILANVCLFQFRLDKKSRYNKHKNLINELLELCRHHHSQLLINGLPDDAVQMNTHGVHLNSARLLQFNERPLDNNFLVSASCHNALELEHACKIDVDFAVLSPVNKTNSHQHATPLNWDKFNHLVAQVNIPVYALGGMRATDMQKSRACGAQGIAVLSGVWGQEDLKEVLDNYLRA